jgi:hypothetical protein
MDQTVMNREYSMLESAKYNQAREELIASQNYVESGLENVESFIENGSVLVTKTSKLVSVLVVENKR